MLLVSEYNNITLHPGRTDKFFEIRIQNRLINENKISEQIKSNNTQILGIKKTSIFSSSPFFQVQFQNKKQI